MKTWTHKQVLKEALPLYLKGNNNQAVLIIHGYTGYTGEYYELAHSLHKKGYTVSLPRLPGHGTNRRDFKSTGWKDWLSHVDNCYADLAAENSSVFIVGLSMGGILALILASRYQPKRVVLLAPAMAIRKKIFYLIPVLQYVLPDYRKKREPEKDASPDREVIGTEYWDYVMPRQVAQIRKLQKTALKNMEKVKAPILLMLSRADATVSEKASQVIRRKLRQTPVKEVILENSHHVLLTGCDKEFVKEQTVSWIEEGK